MALRSDSINMATVSRPDLSSIGGAGDHETRHWLAQTVGRSEFGASALASGWCACCTFQMSEQIESHESSSRSMSTNWRLPVLLLLPRLLERDISCCVSCFHLVTWWDVLLPEAAAWALASSSCCIRLCFVRRFWNQTFTCEQNWNLI